jgi:hypothetical protein
MQVSRANLAEGGTRKFPVSRLRRAVTAKPGDSGPCGFQPEKVDATPPKDECFPVIRRQPDFIEIFFVRVSHFLAMRLHNVSLFTMYY